MVDAIVLDWKREGRLHFARHDGNWLVAHNSPPWFCFEATTKAEAKNMAKEAFHMAEGMRD